MTWAPVPNWPGYFASKRGDIKSTKRSQERILKTAKGTGGYRLSILSRPGKTKTILTHRLVWMAFNGDIPKHLQIAHLNGNPADNRLENLLCCTPKENMSHCKIHGTDSSGSRNWSAKLTETDVIAIKLQRENHLGDRHFISRMAKKYRVSVSTMHRAVTGRSWKVTEDIVKSPEAKEIGGKILTIINDKLDEQVKGKK